MNEEEKAKLNTLEVNFQNHNHDGANSQQVVVFSLFGEVPSAIQLRPATIGTAAASYDDYVIAPIAGQLYEIDFSAVDALAANDTNFITWTITNLGQAGAGTAVMLSTTPAGINTTKSTGGTAIAANTKMSLRVSVATNACAVARGDRLLVRATVSGTLANTVTFPTYCLRFK